MGKIEEQYVKIHDYIKENQAQVIADSSKSKKPRSLLTIHFLATQIDGFLGFLMSKNADSYTANAILRIVIEHYLVGHYLTVKCHIEDSDIAGDQYDYHYFISEFFKRKNYDWAVDDIKNKVSGVKGIERLKKEHPEFKDLEQKDLDDVHRIANQFDVRSIGKYLTTLTEVPSSVAAHHNNMLQFLNMYNELSSYVHGGSFARKSTLDKKDHDKEHKKALEWTMIASKSLKLNILIQLVGDYGNKYRKPVMELLK